MPGKQLELGQGVGNSLPNTIDLLSVGIEFKSFEDLSSVIKSYEQCHFVTFSVKLHTTLYNSV